VVADEVWGAVPPRRARTRPHRPRGQRDREPWRPSAIAA